MVRWARRVSMRDFDPALAALVSPMQNIFVLTVHYFTLCVPIAQQTGQPVVQGRLSLNMCIVPGITYSRFFGRTPPNTKMPQNALSSCSKSFLLLNQNS